MAIRQQRPVGFALASAAVALALCGCAASPGIDRPGVLEVRIHPDASYALIGRFQLTAIEPWSPSRDIDFDRTTSQARIELPEGTFALALGAGARLVCAADPAGALAASSGVPRLVSASPQVISITAGGLTTAHVRFGAPSGAAAAVMSGDDLATGAADPCSGALAWSEPPAGR